MMFGFERTHLESFILCCSTSNVVDGDIYLGVFVFLSAIDAIDFNIPSILESTAISPGKYNKCSV